MAKAPKTAIQPTRVEDYPEWYQQVIRASDLAETSPVRGCMVIKPWGFRLWENMQRALDDMFKEAQKKAQEAEPDDPNDPFKGGKIWD